MRVVIRNRRKGPLGVPVTRVVHNTKQTPKPIQSKFSYTLPPLPQRTHTLSDGMYKSIEKQASDLNIRFIKIESGSLAPAPYHYNSGLIRVDGVYKLAYRRQSEQRDSDIGLVSLTDDLQPVPRLNKILELPKHAGDTEQFEDPRLFWFAGAPWVSYVSWKKFSSGAAINICQLDLNFNVVKEVRTLYGGNWKANVFQKNWVFFEHEGRLLYIYLSNPHEIVNLNPVSGESVLLYREPGVKWSHGQVRGGTPPVRVGDHYFSFFHSRTMGFKGRLRYYMGAYAFKAAPPFDPVSVTSKPILIASEEDDNIATLPLVVFPCGAVFHQDKWVVSLGVNDINTAIVEVSHEKLESWLTPLLK